MNSRNVVHQFGPFQFDPTQYELREGEQRRTLPPALNKLLMLFVSRPGELVTREEIAATLWEQPDAVEVTPGINMAIKRLRTEIGDNNGHGVFIETVIGAGYRFVVPVSALSAGTAATVEPSEAASGHAGIDLARSPWSPWLLPTVVSAVLLLAAGGAWMRGGTPEVVPTTGQIEEFRCSISRGGRCVVREVEGKNQMIYYSLDPLTGMGRELARTTWQPNVLGDWSLSPDGKTVAVANHDETYPAIQLVDLTDSSAGAGRLATVREIAVPGFGTVLEPNWASDGRSFLVETYTTAGYDLASVDMHGQATLLRQSSELVWGVPSPDGKKIAFPGNTPLNRNVWVGSSTRKPD